jgi:N utilization substance protein A
VSRVTIVDSGDKHLEVVVDDSQLSLAIGKKGQNVRLAAKLLGWKIDIKSEEEKRQEVELQMAALAPQVTTPLENVPGLGEGLVEKLGAAGVTTVEALADMTPEQLEAIEGIGPKTVEKISLAVNNYFASLEAGEAVVADGEVPAEEVAAADGEALAEGATAEAEEVPAEASAEGEQAAVEEVSAETEAAAAESASAESISPEPESGHAPEEDAAPEAKEAKE